MSYVLDDSFFVDIPVQCSIIKDTNGFLSIETINLSYNQEIELAGREFVVHKLDESKFSKKCRYRINKALKSIIILQELKIFKSNILISNFILKDKFLGGIFLLMVDLSNHNDQILININSVVCRQTNLNFLG